MNLSQLTQVATEAALAAGQVIQNAIGKEVPVEQKQGGESYASQVVTAVDKAAEAAILSHLLPICDAFDLALLSEETEDDQSRFEKNFFWCIDPMDGTLPFIRQKPGFSVSIALVAKDGTPHIGVVADPSTNTLYHAIRGEGAWKNKKPWNIQNTNDHLTYVTDRKLKDTPRADDIRQFLRQQTTKLGLSGVRERSGGGAVLNAIRVLENGPACMLKFPKKEQGGGSIWDFAATACIFQEVGLSATNFIGGRLDLNRRDSTFMNHEGVLYLNW
jgi:fructose-1,6-bisphosphatase/inositol monophosphatase family enzyme